MWGGAASLLLVYAIAKGDPVFISLQSYHAVASALVIYYCLRYRGQPCGLRDGGQLCDDSKYRGRDNNNSRLSQELVVSGGSD